MSFQIGILDFISKSALTKICKSSLISHKWQVYGLGKGLAIALSSELQATNTPSPSYTKGELLNYMGR